MICWVKVYENYSATLPTRTGKFVLAVVILFPGENVSGRNSFQLV